MAEFETDYLAHHDGERSLDVIYSKSLDEATNYLEHYQIKGAKHGVRRFQNYDGTLTAAGRERYGIGPPREKKTEESSVKKAVESVKKKVKDTKEKNADKKRAKRAEFLRDHPKQLPRFKRILTEQEADDIIRKIQFDHRLQDIRDEEVQRGRKRFENRVAHTTQIKKLMSNSTDMYNSTAKVVNALISSGVIDSSRFGKLASSGQLPIVGEVKK